MLQGERALASENVSLGTFSLELPDVLIPEADQIFIGFAINADGLLVVTALEKKTNSQAFFEFSNSAGTLNKKELQRLICAAKERTTKEMDKTQKEKIEITSETNVFKAMLEQIVLGINVDALSSNGISIDSMTLIEAETVKKDLRETQKTLKLFLIHLLDAYFKLDVNRMKTFTEDTALITLVQTFEDGLVRIQEIESPDDPTFDDPGPNTPLDLASTADIDGIEFDWDDD